MFVEFSCCIIIISIIIIIIIIITELLNYHVSRIIIISIIMNCIMLLPLGKGGV